MDALVKRCCICFEELPEGAILFPCRHNQVCHTCICSMTDLKCPLCREHVEYVIFKMEESFVQPQKYSPVIQDKQRPSSNRFSNELWLPLRSIIRFRVETCLAIVQNTFQVYFIGSSCVDFKKPASHLQAAFPLLPEKHPICCKKSNKLQNLKSQNQELFGKVRVAAAVDKWKERYLPNACFFGTAARIHSYPFWEWLQVLRDGGTLDGIFPDVVVVCLHASYSSSISEAIEMQEIMANYYQKVQRKLQSVWIVFDADGSGKEERRGQSVFLDVLRSLATTSRPQRLIFIGSHWDKRQYRQLGSYLWQYCSHLRPSEK